LSNICLHINNFARLGGIETTVIDIARSFPQLYHILLTINPDGEDLNFIKHLQNQHVKYMNAEGKITQQMVDAIDPFIIMLHNTQGKDLEGEYPYAWLNKYKTIGCHHMATYPLIPTTMDWFISDWVRAKYKNCESRMKNAFVMPPCIWSAPYINITRPVRIPVVGRIQSGTWGHRGKVSDTYYELLLKLKGCTYFGVGPNSKAIDDRFKVMPIKAGGMAEYLKEIDIFTIWGDTTESWSKVATEAMLSGIPVVARNHGDGLAEQIRKSHGGILVNTEQGFVEAVQKLIDEPELRKQYGLAGKLWALKNATTTTLRNKMLDTFLEWSLN
jgi:hypothetical protein